MDFYNWNISIKHGFNKMTILNANSFISKHIIDWVIDNKDKFYNIILTDGKSIISLYCLNKYEVDYESITCVTRILIFVRGMSKSKKSCNVIIILSPFKKLLNASEILGPDNCNSGVTSDEEYILIWRKEEMFKVLIHELIHFYKLDFSDIIFKKSYENKIKSYDNSISSKHCVKNVNDQIIFNEAYCETLATLINCIIYSIHNNSNLKKTINIEIQHSIKQTAKILNHFNFKSADDFFDNDSCSVKLMESTNVFAYYIIKSQLLYNYKKFKKITNEKKNISTYKNKLLPLIKFDHKWIALVNSAMKKKDKTQDLRMTCISIIDQ